jgi:hypothetical protein
MKCLTCGTVFKVEGLFATHITTCGGCCETETPDRVKAAEDMLLAFVAARVAGISLGDEDGYAFMSYSSFMARFPTRSDWVEWYRKQHIRWQLEHANARIDIKQGIMDITCYFNEGELEENEDALQSL